MKDEDEKNNGQTHDPEEQNNEQTRESEEERIEDYGKLLSANDIMSRAHEVRFKVYVKSLKGHIMCRNISGRIRAETHQGMIKLAGKGRNSKMEIDTITLQILTIKNCLISPDPKIVIPHLQNLPATDIEEIYTQIERNSTHGKFDDAGEPIYDEEEKEESVPLARSTTDL